MKDFYEAYERQRKAKDEENWMLGIYIQSAVLVAVERVLVGKKAKSKYIEEPIMSSETNSKEDHEYTEEEKKQYAMNLFTQLELMAANHRLSKEKEQQEKD